MVFRFNLIGKFEIVKELKMINKLSILILLKAA